MNDDGEDRRINALSATSWTVHAASNYARGKPLPSTQGHEGVGKALSRLFGAGTGKWTAIWLGIGTAVWAILHSLPESSGEPEESYTHDDSSDSDDNDYDDLYPDEVIINDY